MFGVSVWRTLSVKVGIMNFISGSDFKFRMISLVTQLIKYPPAIQETLVQSLSWEDPLRREWLPTPVFLPGEFNGLYSPWYHKELDTTEWLSLSMCTVEWKKKLGMYFNAYDNSYVLHFSFLDLYQSNYYYYYYYYYYYLKLFFS